MAGAESERLPAGWYQIPGDSTHEGYWSGDSWTDQRRPRAVAAPTPLPTPPPLPLPAVLSSQTVLSADGKSPIEAVRKILGMLEDRPGGRITAISHIQQFGIFGQAPIGWSVVAVVEWPEPATETS